MVIVLELKQAQKTFFAKFVSLVRLTSNMPFSVN